MSAADITDTSQVDAVFANQQRNADNARRRAMVWTAGKSILIGGLGIGALLFGASFLVQPKIIKVPELIEVPTVYETTRLIEVPKIVEVPKIIAGGKLIDPPKPTPAPAAPATVSDAPAPTRTWNELIDKQYVGIITSVTDDQICFDHSTTNCTAPALVDENGHARLDPEGNIISDRTKSNMPMAKWINYSVYKAVDPGDPIHLSHFWVANNGTLIQFHAGPRGAPVADSVTLQSDDGGASLHLDLGLGASTYSFLLDTGATDPTVTEQVAAQLVADGHGVYGREETVTIADGTSHIEPTLEVDAVTVGAHRVSNVHALVVPNSAPMLLGMGVLNRIGRFTVDAQNRQLIFEGFAS